MVYTKAGPTLIAVNPFKNIPGLYGHRVICECHKQQNVGTFPHLGNTELSLIKARSPIVWPKQRVQKAAKVSITP